MLSCLRLYTVFRNFLKFKNFWIRLLLYTVYSTVYCTVYCMYTVVLYAVYVDIVVDKILSRFAKIIRKFNNSV